MAQEKLLFNVILFHLVLLVALGALGNPIAPNEIFESTLNKPILRVFVSHSLPISLLKSYAKEAKKYNAILVFKGLPNGSFMELSKLILSLKDENKKNDELCLMQIDDEAFDRFKVTSVPSIVLSDQDNCEIQAACKPAYDKVDGNIDIRSALEKFASEGDMSMAARAMIKQADIEAIK